MLLRMKHVSLAMNMSGSEHHLRVFDNFSQKLLQCIALIYTNTNIIIYAYDITKIDERHRALILKSIKIIATFKRRHGHVYLPFHMNNTKLLRPVLGISYLSCNVETALLHCSDACV